MEAQPLSISGLALVIGECDIRRFEGLQQQCYFEITRQNRRRQKLFARLFMSSKQPSVDKRLLHSKHRCAGIFEKLCFHRVFFLRVGGWGGVSADQSNDAQGRKI